MYETNVIGRILIAYSFLLLLLKT